MGGYTIAALGVVLVVYLLHSYFNGTKRNAFTTFLMVLSCAILILSSLSGNVFFFFFLIGS